MSRKSSQAASVNTLLWYLLTKTKCTWSLKIQCLLGRKSFEFFIDQLHNKVMKIRKGYKYRLKTNPETAQQFARFAGACRFVWNKILSINEGRYLAGVPRLAYNDAAGLLTLWKQSAEYGWLTNVHSKCCSSV